MITPFRLFDRYVAGIFLKRMFFSLTAAIVIFVVVDLVQRLDRFIDKDVGVMLIVSHYGYMVPYIIYLVLPVAVLLSTLFTLGGLSQSHELTAMKASGIGVHRILYHLLFFGILLSGWNFVFGETIVPYTTKQSKDIYRTHVKGISPDKASHSGNIYLRNNLGELVHVKHYDAKKETVFNLDWQQYEGETMRRRLLAQKAVWRDSAWAISAAEQWFFQPDTTIFVRIFNESFRDLGFYPSDLVKVQTDPEEMGYWQLDRFVGRLEEMGGDPVRWSVELAFKTAMPWTCAIVVLLGVPIAAHYRRSGVTLSFGIGLFISFVFFGFQQIGKVAGYNGVLTPHLAAWVGNVVFILLGLFLYWKVEK
jgi:lipopolysaccharide export system permease protein